MTVSDPLLPKDFFWRRMHSLMGLWLVLFLIEHLLTNSQAALWIGDDGSGFVRAVNRIKELPYLYAIELILLGIPFFIHMVWGVKYLMEAKPNSTPSDGRTPSLPQYPRNHAYTWQRITSWILLIAIIGHVGTMRFLNYPEHVRVGGQDVYYSTVHHDAGLTPLSERLNFKVVDKAHLPTQIEDKFKNLKENQVIISSDFGTAELLMVRDSFKSPLMIFLYTIFVLAAVYHAFNGLWTFLITWGVSLTAQAQHLMRRFAVLLMLAIGFLGLAAVWGTYWINLQA